MTLLSMLFPKYFNTLIILVIILIFSSFQPDNLLNSKSSTDLLLEEKSNLVEEHLYQAAIDKLWEAKVIFEDKKDWKNVVSCLYEMYLLNDYLSDNKGEQYLREALYLTDLYLPKYLIETGEVIQSLGELYALNNQLDSSIIALKTAIDIFNTLEEKEKEVWTSITLATTFYYQETLDSMFFYLSNAQEIADAHQLGSDVFDAIYELFGVYYYANLDVNKAILYSNRSLDLIANLPQKTIDDSIHMANLYNNLAVYYNQKTDLKRASYFYEKCLSIFTPLNIPSIENIDIIINYSQTLYQLQEYKISLLTLKKIVNIEKEYFSNSEEKKWKNRIYGGIINNYFALSELDSATHYVNKLLALSTNKIYSPNDLLIKGRLFFYQKQFNQAERTLLKIINDYTINQHNLQVGDQYFKYSIASVYSLLGEIKFQEKKYLEALEYFQKSFDVNIMNPDKNISKENLIDRIYNINSVLESLKNIAATQKAMNTKKSTINAFETYNLAIEVIERIRKGMVFNTSKEQLSLSRNIIYKGAIKAAIELYQSTNKEYYLEAAFQITEKQKATILLEHLIDEQGKAYYNVPESLLRREEDLKNDIGFFQQKMLQFQNKEDSIFQIYKQKHTQTNINFALLKDTLKTYYQEYFNLEYQTSIASISSIQSQLLKSNEVFIQYTEVDSFLYVFIVEKDKKNLIALPYGSQERSLLRRLKTNLTEPNLIKENGNFILRDFIDLSTKAYTAIFEPILDNISSKTKSFIIASEGNLSTLPFEILLNKKKGIIQDNFIDLPYLIKKYQFYYGYSGTLLLENNENYKSLKSNNKLLAFAPQYQASKDKLIQPLRKTITEVDMISKYFGYHKTYKNNATERNFKANIQDYGILHLAMHGTANIKQPDLAYLVFSNLQNDTLEDNKLHHYEIAELNHNAQLTVLSACETGIGKEIEGEGVLSLGWAFMYAGVPSVVMSLWKTDDLSTSELMPLFYEQLANCKRKDIALRQAKLTYLDNAILERAHPFYWAGFIGIGNSQPIKKINNQTYFMVIPIFLVGLGLIFFLLRRKSIKL